jgi:hypothetical protein
MEVVIREKKPLWHQHKNTIFPLNIHWTELKVFSSGCYNGSPDGKDIQGGLTDNMTYRRYVVDGFLLFPVVGDVHSARTSLLSNELWLSSYASWANFEF